MADIGSLYNELALKAGKGTSYDKLGARPKAKIFTPFCKRYKQLGGQQEGEGLKSTFEKDKGVQALLKTILHIIDHIKGEIDIEVQLVGNNSTVGDLEEMLQQLNLFV